MDGSFFSLNDEAVLTDPAYITYQKALKYLEKKKLSNEFQPESSLV